MPSTIEIINVQHGNIFLNFGDIKALDPPIITHGDLLLKDFSDPNDLIQLKQVLQDEDLNFSFNNPGVDFIASTQSILSLSKSFQLHFKGGSQGCKQPKGYSLS